MEKSKRPWGKYTVIQEESNFKLKMIEVNPGQRLSYQYHNKRSEVWTIVEGKGKLLSMIKYFFLSMVTVLKLIKSLNIGFTIILTQY